MSQLEEIKKQENPIVYVDETGFETNTERQYGWGLTGKRIRGYRCGLKRKVYNLVGGYLNHKLLAPYIFHETCTAQVFHDWLHKHLLPKLKHGTIIVLDNARFHKKKETEDLVTKAGCRLLFLPPYSPHLNPIEKLWGNMKKFRRNHAKLSIDELVNKYC